MHPIVHHPSIHSCIHECVHSSMMHACKHLFIHPILHPCLHLLPKAFSVFLIKDRDTEGLFYDWGYLKPEEKTFVFKKQSHCCVPQENLAVQEQKPPKHQSQAYRQEEEVCNLFAGITVRVITLAFIAGNFHLCIWLSKKESLIGSWFTDIIKIALKFFIVAF